MRRPEDDFPDWDDEPPLSDSGEPEGLPPLPPLEAYAGDPEAEPGAGGGPTVVSAATPGGDPDRARALRGAMLPLDRISPVLSSRYLVKHWIDRGAASSIYASPKGWKTFFALDMAMHVAAGRDWHGHGVSEAGAVLYVAGEGGVGIRNRIDAIRKARPDLAAAAKDRFVLLPVSVDLCGPQDVEHLAGALAGRDWQLVVVDTLARAMGEGDENTAKDMGAFVRNVDRLRELTRAHAAVIHHTGKDAGRGARGSNALLAAVDTEIRITREGDVAVAETTNQRDMPAGRRFAFTLEDVGLGIDEDGDQVTSAVVVQTDAPEGGNRAGLGKNQKVAIEALEQFTAASGVPCPSGPGWPEGGARRVVDRDAFLGFLREKMTSDNPDNRRRTAHRALDDLVDRGLVQSNAGMLWII